MIHTLAVLHVASAIVAFVVIVTVVSLVKALAGGQKRQTHPYQRVPRHRGKRRLITALHYLFAGILWTVMTPLGWLVANKRYGVVAPVLRPFEESVQARNHRIGHALCVPFLLWPHWIVRCRGCHAWILLREVPARDHGGVDLKVVRGNLYGAGRCAARYLVAPQPAPVPHIVPPAAGRNSTDRPA